MIRRRVSTIALVLSLAAGGASAQVTIHLDSRQAFLHVDSADAAQPAPAIDLAALGLMPGQSLLLEPLGDFDNGPGGDQYSNLIVVFSGSGTLLPPSEADRVPDAVDAGFYAVTGPTEPSYEPTDIPYDFYVVKPGRTVVIPPGATHLFVAPAEVYYIDNTDPDADFGVRLTAVAAADTPVATARLTLSAYPNPFNPQTSIAFELAVGGQTRLTIHDLGGRLVRTLAAGDLAAGRHELTWDGRDDAGRGLASGCYLARLTAADGQQAIRLSLVR